MKYIINNGVSHIRYVILQLMLLCSVCSTVQAVEQIDVDLSMPSSSNEILEIQTTVFVLDLDGIDTQNQSFEANVFLACVWHDPRWKGVHPTAVTRTLDQVWHPHVQILNQQKVFKTFPDEVRILPDGTVRWRQRYWGSFSQPLQLGDFPFDSQSFDITLVASLPVDEPVRMVASHLLPSGMGEILSVADWDIIQYSAETAAVSIVPSMPAVNGFVFNFKTKRRVGYFIVKVIIPLVLITAMSWIVFWIDPRESGTQISVAITTMLTLIAYRFAVDSSLPKVSYLTSLDYFILMSTVLVYASLIEVLVTSNLAKKETGLARAMSIDNWGRIIFPALFLLSAIETLYLRILF